jgi:hypothetical protein
MVPVQDISVTFTAHAWTEDLMIWDVVLPKSVPEAFKHGNLRASRVHAHTFLTDNV